MQGKTLLQAYPKGSADAETVQAAYDLAAEAHGKQTRTGGGPYISHPLAVAQKVQDFGLDANSVAAALLHDVVEDTDVSLDEIRERFGDDVAVLVDALTKVEGIHYDEGDAHKAETYRKIILATAKDVRVVIIKLMDRLHNISTADVFSPERKRRYAEETLHVYAPIAYRLGFASIKDELEDYAFALLDPERHEEVVAIIKDQVSKSEKLLKELAANLEADLKASGLSGFEIRSREKSPYSLNEKLARGRSLQDVYDIFGLRVITEDLGDCYLALGRVHTLWHPVPGRFADYIANPKSNMYQSLHTTVSSDQGIVFEVQIRTWEMHAIAQYGLAAHWHYKNARQEKLAAIDSWLQDLAEQQKFLQDPGEILDTLISETFKEEIYTFTPKGNVRVLPVGATPVDFAYAVHSSVGNRCTGAKVNGRITALSSKLSTGDIVEIMTTKNENARPSTDWLRFVVTHKARTQIRKFVQEEIKAEDELRGLQDLQEEFRKRKLKLEDIGDEALQKLGCSTKEEVYYRVGTGKLSPKHVLRTVTTGTAAAPVPLPTTKKSGASTGNVVALAGRAGDRSVPQTMARCCNPLPGDDIKAYISMGRGIIIHRADCPNIEEHDQERLLDASWREDVGSSTFMVTLILKAGDRPRLMEDISHLLAERGASIDAVDMRMRDEVVQGRLTLELANSQSLPVIIGELRSLDDVLSVERARS